MVGIFIDLFFDIQMTDHSQHGAGQLGDFLHLPNRFQTKFPGRKPHFGEFGSGLRPGTVLPLIADVEVSADETRSSTEISSY